jgi:hypothetical protein
MTLRQFYDWQTMGGAKDVSRLVAALEDTVAGNLAAYFEPQRRATKKLKDTLDIGRLVEAHPQLLASLPDDIVVKLNP